MNRVLEGGKAGHRAFWCRLLVLLAVLGTLLPRAPAALAHDPLPEILASAQFEQNLGERVPLDLVFHDETGKAIRLAEIIGDKPVVLTMNYYECESLCPLVMEGAASALKLVPFTIGDEFDIVTVSIDPDETPALATEVKERLVHRYEREGAASNWHVLTGDKPMIDRLASAVGFNYAWDEAGQQYAHPSGLIVLGPGGVIARYIYGFEFSPRDLRLALVEASENRIASPVDRVLLFCYRYNPAIGQYSAIAVSTMRLAGLATIAGLVGLIGWLILLERKRQSPFPTGTG